MKAISNEQFLKAKTNGHWIAWFSLALAIILPAPLFSQRLQQGCELGFQSGTTIADPDINGNPGSPAAKWSDATVLQSGYPCLNPLPDWDGTLPGNGNHVTPNLLKVVTVRSKRDDANLYLDFEVQDQTKNENDYSVTGGPLPLGERIIVQINPSLPLGGSLGTGAPGSPFAYRIEVAHKWGPSLTDQKFFNSGATSSICGQQDWSNTGTFPSTIKVGLGATTIAGSYVIEMKIPFSQIGNPQSDIGIAFAVINDLGYAASAGVYDATGVSFPASLPLNNGANASLTDPNSPAGCGAWLQPNQWAGGYFNSPPTDVTISRNPVAWESDAISAFECGTAGYDYYQANPCKINVQATVVNTDAAPAVRNLLYLWGAQDAGGPLWTFLDLKKGVSIPTGSQTFNSVQWTPPSDALINHPCVRVYILPASFKAPFDEATIRAMVSAPDATITSLESTYQVAIQQWAQKNLTRVPGSVACPIQGCTGELRRPSSPFSNILEWARTHLSLRNIFRLSTVEAAPAVTGTAFTAPARSAEGSPILLPAADLAKYRADNVVIQVRTFGSSNLLSAKRPTYNFVEPIGGLIQLIPVALIKKGTVNIKFNVTNPGKAARMISLKVDTLPPAGVGPIKVIFSPQVPTEYGPGQTNTIGGAVATAPVKKGFCSPGDGKPAIFLPIGMLLVGLFIYRPRRKPHGPEGQ